jgi:exodeoxyribonuclease VII large subunit
MPTDSQDFAPEFVAPPGWLGSMSGQTAAPQVWGVSALVKAMSDALQTRFNPVTVKGELSGYSRAASGHCYFNLKDSRGDAQLRCAMFKRVASGVDFSPRDGDLVEVQARVGVYEARGDLQLVVEDMKRAGQGSLFEQFLQLKAKLQAQGLFEESRKRQLVPLPRGIGLVTSLGAAALHDVSTALARRVPHIPVYLSPASVQGSGAAVEIIAALQRLYALADNAQTPVDVILLVRGGGSLDDLWSFNDEALVRTIAQSPVPVVCGVGHETDFTLADFVADLRAPTPTAAAELCALPREQWMQHLQSQRQRLLQAVQDFGEQHQQRLDACADKLTRPTLPLVRASARLREMAQQLSVLTASRLVQCQHRLERTQTQWTQGLTGVLDHEVHRLHRHAIRLKGLDPALVLERGYAWLQSPDGHALSSVSQIQTGQVVQARLADGRVDLTAN